MDFTMCTYSLDPKYRALNDLSFEVETCLTSFNSDTRRFRDFYVIFGEGGCIANRFESTILEDEIYSIEFIGTLEL